MRVRPFLKIIRIFIAVIVITLSISVSFAEALNKSYLQAMLEREEFKELDALAENIRTSRVRNDTGDWVLDVFYDKLTGVSYTKKSFDDNYQKQIGLMEKWRKASPSSPTPLVALAKLYSDYALKARASGWSSKTGKSTLQVYKERLKKASEYASDSTARKCIRSYYESIHILDLLRSEDRLESAIEIFNEGYEKEPDYYPLYSAMADMLMEKKDFKRGAIKKFLDVNTAEMGWIRGHVIYVKALLKIHGDYEFYNFLSTLGISWDDMDSRFKYLLKKRPDIPWVPNAYWYFATAAGDFDKAEQMAELLDETNGWIHDSELFNPQHYKKAKETYRNRKHTVFLKLDLNDVWNGSTNLTEEYSFIDPEGKKTGGTDNKERLYTDRYDFYNNHSMTDFVRVITVPQSILKEKITVKYTVFNDHLGTEATASYDLDPPANVEEAQNANDQKCESGNLLKNPKADEDLDFWKARGDSGTVRQGSNYVFFTRLVEAPPSIIVQFITLPPGCDKKFMVVAGYSMVERVMQGSITNRPFLFPVISRQENAPIFVDELSLLNGCGENCWGPMWVIYHLSDDATSLRLEMKQAIRGGIMLDGARAYFDDLELRLFGTKEDAVDFLDGYMDSHPAVKVE
jgi:tetratricopeptide (TPR) repeat protein